MEKITKETLKKDMEILNEVTIKRLYALDESSGYWKLITKTHSHRIASTNSKTEMHTIIWSIINFIEAEEN